MPLPVLTQLEFNDTSRLSTCSQKAGIGLEAEYTAFDLEWKIEDPRLTVKKAPFDLKPNTPVKNALNC